jgi:hypothetical protein
MWGRLPSLLLTAWKGYPTSVGQAFQPAADSLERLSHNSLERLSHNSLERLFY